MHHDSAGYHNAPARQPAAAHHWRRIGLWLVGATMAYNTIEGVVALWAGIQAGSIALVGFGLDSFGECAAATALFWRSALKRGGQCGGGRTEWAACPSLCGWDLSCACPLCAPPGWVDTLEPGHCCRKRDRHHPCRGVAGGHASGRLGKAACSHGPAQCRFGQRRRRPCLLLSVLHAFVWPRCQCGGWLVVGRPCSCSLYGAVAREEGREGLRGEECCE